MNESMPATLGDAIATEPMWLQGWVFVLVGTHLLSVLFMVERRDDSWVIRFEAIAILASFFAAAFLMGWLYNQFGYTRLLGLAHLVFWTPAFVWVLMKRKAIGHASVYGKYILLYLAIAGTSLAIDLIDLIRYLAGDGELLNRWG